MEADARGPHLTANIGRTIKVSTPVVLRRYRPTPVGLSRKAAFKSRGYGFETDRHHKKNRPDVIPHMMPGVTTRLITSIAVSQRVPVVGRHTWNSVNAGK